MNEKDGLPVDDPIERERRRQAKVHNDRIKFLVDVGKAVLVGLIVIGFVQATLAPEAAPVSVRQFILTLAAVVTLTGVVWFGIGRQRSEE